MIQQALNSARGFLGMPKPVFTDFVDDDGLTPSVVINERIKAHQKNAHRDKVYRLRLIAANYLLPGLGRDDTTGESRPDVDVTDWEEARHNPLGINTVIQAKSLAFGAPDVRWTNIPENIQDSETISEVRRAYYLKEFEEQHFAEMYRNMVMDLVIGGESTIRTGVRDEVPYAEWGNAAAISWDPAFKETHRKRYFIEDVCLPLGEAIEYYPGLAKVERPEFDGRNYEKIITLVCYYDKRTVAVKYKNEFVDGPKPTPYKRLPATYQAFIRKPSVQYPTGSVEEQIGSLTMLLRLQRSMREKALRAGTIVGVVNGGNVDESVVKRIEEGEECVIVRMPPGGDFNWRTAGEITQTEIELSREMDQHMNAESGVNDFQRGQTDTQVDFASQLSFLASQSGVQGDYASLIAEEGVKNSINAFMDMAGQFENRDMTLDIANVPVPFGPAYPIAPLLGSNGTMVFKPGGMKYKAASQKLQEVAVLGNVLQMAMQMPPALQPNFVDAALDAAEVENKSEWMENLNNAIAYNAQLDQQQLQQQQLEAQSGGGQPPQEVR